MVEASDGIQYGVPSTNATKLCHPLETFVAPNVDMTLFLLGIGFIQDIMDILAHVLGAFNISGSFIIFGLNMCKFAHVVSRDIATSMGHNG